MSDDKELGVFNTGLAIGDLYFKDENDKKVDLFPAIYSLVAQCSDLIKEPGIYEFTLKIRKLK